MLLRGLAEAPDLRLRVLVGEDALDRPVDGVFTTDLLDPRRYLTGGEIVLTGLMWRRDPADSEAFVATLTAAGAVALAAGDAALGSVPADLVAACRRHGMPLFEVPVDVSFAAITERVLAARLRPAGPAGPGPAVARLRALAGGRGGAGGPAPGAAGAPGGLSAVLEVAASEFGVTGWVISAAGRLVAASGAPRAPGRQARAALAGAWLAAGGLPATVLAGGESYSLAGVMGEPAQRLAGWFVAVAGDQAGWDTDRRAITAELAAAATAHRARHEESRRAARRVADDLLGQLLARPATGPGDPELAAALRRCGLPVCPPLVAVALTAGPAGPDTGPGAPAWPLAARVLLEEMLPGSVVGVHGGEAVGIAPGGAGVLDQIREMTRALGGVYGLADPAPGAAGQAGPAAGLSLAFGVGTLAAGDDGPAAGGDPGGPGPGGTAAGIGRAVAQARQARQVAALLGGVRVVDAARLGSVELLLATVPPQARQAFQSSLLSPLLDYDAAHGTELVRTLRVFLDCSTSWTRAAEAMFVHVNSLRYRMRRVEELTGRDLGSLADQAALLLALRLAGLAAPARGSTPPSRGQAPGPHGPDRPGGLRPGSSVTGPGPA